VIDSGYAIGVIIAMGAVTFALRALPFIAGQWLQRHAVVRGLGKFLPLAIMTLLLLHSMVSAAAGQQRGLWPGVLAVALVMVLQWRWRNPLLSILAGTGVYVLLVNGLVG
jgi:branched-subunit amino acid transport protein AzlD